MTTFILLGILTASGTVTAPAGILEAMILIHAIDEVKHEVEKHGDKPKQRGLR